MSIKKIKANICVAEGEYMGANSSCINTREGMVVIDTPYLPNEVKKWQAEMAKLGNNKKTAYVINTDYHYDHCMGNSMICPNVVSHELTYKRMLEPDGTGRRYFLGMNQLLPQEVKQQVYDIALGIPTVTFSDQMGLHMGDANFQLMHMGGHTDATIIIRLVDEGVLFSGDEVSANSHPYTGDANFKQWMDVLERILKMEVDVIIPGHGVVCGKPEAAKLLDYFRQRWGRVMDLKKKGVAKEEVVKQLHSMIDYFPIDPTRVAQTNLYFEQGTARMYEQA